MTTDSELIPRHSLTNLCAAFNAAVATARENATRNQAAADHLAAVWGSDPTDTCRRRTVQIDLQTPDQVEAAIINAKRYAWNELVDRTGIRHLMSVKQQEELDRQLWDEGSKWKPGSDDNLPPLEPETVYAWLAQLGQNLPSMLEAAINEVFDMLTPQRRKHGDQYATNDAHCRAVVGRKVILTWFLESYGRYVRHERTKHLTALGNVFRMLEGKGPAHYPNDLPTRLAAWWKEHPADPFEDEHFKIKAYWHTRTLHITMLRLDLVKELNIRAGRRVLTPQQ